MEAERTLRFLEATHISNPPHSSSSCLRPASICSSPVFVMCVSAFLRSGPLLIRYSDSQSSVFLHFNLQRHIVTAEALQNSRKSAQRRRHLNVQISVGNCFWTNSQAQRSRSSDNSSLTSIDLFPTVSIRESYVLSTYTKTWTRLTTSFQFFLFCLKLFYFVWFFGSYLEGHMDTVIEKQSIHL